ncbi:MAG: hypothetical protein EOO39_42815, partial [Cytophagaceae bacterium]
MSLSRRLLAPALVALTLFVGGIAQAATFVVPNVTEDAAVSGLNTPLRNAARAYQGYVDESQLGALTGPVQITGMAFRLAIGTNWSPDGLQGAGTWPSQDLTFSQYDIQLSRASAAVQAAGEFPSLTPTFAANQGGTVTTVRSGALTIPAGSYTASGSTTTPNAFGFNIQFTTPYLYTPGQELVYTIRHSGYSPNGEPQVFFASDDYTPNAYDAVSSTVGANAAAPNGFSSPLIVQYTYSAITVVPEGNTALLVGAALPVVG